MHFREDPHRNEALKERHLQELESLILRREEKLAATRATRCAHILQDKETHRRGFLDMLGWPLNADLPRPTPRAEILEELGEEGEHTLFRMRIEVMEGLWLNGLYYRLNSSEARPLVICQHGGAGTPELVSGFYFDGSTVNYHAMLTGLLPHRVHVFMPALLLWDASFYGQPYDRIRLDARLKRVGGSITALEVYAITRAIDYFEATLRPLSFGMVGCSYGGHYTLFTTAADPRIRSSIASSFFCERGDYAWPDWTWKNAAALYDDAEIACLCHPRHLCVAMGDRDELFRATQSQKAAERVKAYSRLAGIDPDTWFDSIIFEGVHEYIPDPAPVERLIHILES